MRQPTPFNEEADVADRMWDAKAVDDMGSIFYDVCVEGEIVARHTDTDYAHMHVDAMNAIESDPVVAAAVEREAMRRLGER